MADLSGKKGAGIPLTLLETRVEKRNRTDGVQLAVTDTGVRTLSDSSTADALERSISIRPLK